jgi:mRNA-degrading endonuclease RelE of RelBE toxin-antitoxin system
MTGALFQIRYSEAAQEAIAAMTARERSIVLSGIREQLSHEPTRETRNRKPMRASPRVLAIGATWELRIAGVWRVFYSVDEAIVTVDVIDIARKGRETTDQVLGDAANEEADDEDDERKDSEK